MREFTAPLTTAVTVSGNLTDDVQRNSVEAPDAVLMSRRSVHGWQDITALEFQNAVASVAAGLLAAGVQAGDRVALISKTRYEWTLLDYAIWWVGAATVPIYPTSSADQIEWILADSGAAACVVETAEHRSRVEQVKDHLSELKHLWTLEEDGVASIVALGDDVDAGELESRRAGVGAQHLATVIYTSGTTGRPKGCMLTHGNFMHEAAVALEDLEELFEVEGASTVLFMPLAHVFPRLVQVGCMKARVRLGHTADVRSLVDDLREFRPTFILAVPRIFERLFTSASQSAHSEGRGRAFDAAAATAIRYSRALDRRHMNPLLRARHAAMVRMVAAELRAALGGDIRYAISGGAPLGERLAHFFRGIGIPVLEGYGLTETTGAVTVNRPGDAKIGTVGQPLGGVSVRVSDDGELLVKGRQVFVGYWRNEEATHRALDAHGWLRTGDLGEIDDEGYVRITGRKKEILVTAGGKNVAPGALEDIIQAHPLVSQALVVGEARPFVAALITLDRKALEGWRSRHDKRADLSRLVSDPDLIAEIQLAVDEANETVSRAESIRRFEVLTADWTEQSGHVTPTLKLKRRAVMRDFQDAIDRLYR